MERTGRRCWWALAAVAGAVAVAVAVAFGGGLTLTPAPAGAQGAPPGPLRFLGEFVYPAGSTFGGTAVGELSGLVHDPGGGVLRRLRRPQRRPLLHPADRPGAGGHRGRAGGGDDPAGQRRGDAGGAALPGRRLDLEEIVLLPGWGLAHQLRARSDQRPLAAPLRARRPAAGGAAPAGHVRPRGGPGDADQPGLRGHDALPDGAELVLANEQALAQDGPLATPDAGTSVRLLRYDLRGGPGAARPGREVVYQTERIFARPEPPTGRRTTASPPSCGSGTCSRGSTCSSWSAAS